MLNNSVIMERLEEIQRNLTVLEEIRRIPRDAFVSDPKHYLLAERCLQLAIECLTDICFYVASKSGWGKPSDSAGAIFLMGDKGVLDPGFARRIVGMANFRNILVHAYLPINRSIVYDHVQEIEDFYEFERQVIRHLGIGG
jgi:uncharacterized protein YutE (UPF0331/DUF86 family)